MRWFSRSFLSIDPRTLGLTRVLLALLLLADLAKRSGGISLWYINDGLLPNHRMLWQPLRQWGFSVLAALRASEEVSVAFALIALVYLALLVGYRTRLMQVLSWFCALSLQVRVDLLSNGGDFVLCSLLLWTLFLPLGRRYSIDALLMSLRKQAAGVSDAPDVSPVNSLGVLAVMLQLSVIYFFNAVHKTGPTWDEGTAIHYLLHQARIVTAFGVWLREHAPLIALKPLAYGTLIIEFVAPFLILSPWGRPWTRRAALLSLWGLHIGIALVSNLGLFSPTMMVFASLLSSPEDFALWERWLAQPTRAARIIRSTVTRVQDRLTRTLLWLHHPNPWQPSLAPGRVFLSRASVGLREAVVVLLIIVATSQVLIENPVITRHLRVRQPRLLRAAVSYLRLNQGWSMFAPDAPRSDMTIVVDATTTDGRRIDPYNAVAARVADPLLRKVPDRLAHNVFWCDYTVRIPGQGGYQDILAAWIFKHHERTGKPADRIVAFDAYLVEQQSPEPGTQTPKDIRQRIILSRGAARRSR